jgi:DNA invertase Pin-like site-specific DNA recombinase
VREILSLIGRNVRLLTTDGDDLTASDDPTRKMMRQIAGAFAEYEKARLVAKLKQARDRIRKEKGKCEGRLSRVERATRFNKETGEAVAHQLAEAVTLAKRLHRANPKTHARMSLRRISAALADAGYLSERAVPYHPQSIKNMISC